MEPKKKNSPLRKCIGCGEMRDKRELLRVVKQPEGDIALDSTGKKNGRGAYICRNGECLAKAKKTRRLEKSFKCQIASEIYDELENGLKDN